MSWTLSTSGAAINKAGKYYDTYCSGAMLTTWSDNAEAQLSLLTREDWVLNYTSVNTNFKAILDDATSDLIAMRIVAYNMDGYTSRLEASTILDLIRDNFSRCLEALKDFKNKEKMI